jgi:hypothetical protein
MISELWTPQGVTHTSVTPLGPNKVTADTIYQYQFRVHDEVTNRYEDFTVLLDNQVSKAHVEEMVGNAFESWLIDVRLRHSKPPPTQAQKKEIGKILNDYRIHRDKRAESSSNRIHFNGLQ